MLPITPGGKCCHYCQCKDGKTEAQRDELVQDYIVLSVKLNFLVPFIQFLEKVWVNTIYWDKRCCEHYLSLRYRE